MERQSSIGSQGSGKSSATKIVRDAQKHGDSVESQNVNNGFTTALFGVLFTLAKEKYSDSWKVAVLTVVVDFFLILAIMLNLEYPWAVNPHNPLFRFFYMLEIHKPLSAAGYKFYMIVFYLLSGMLFLSVAICVWVAWCFKNDSFPFLWPIKFVRVVVSLFFGMLYIAALNIFLVIIECAPSHGVWVQHIWHVECLAMPHMVHVVVSFLSSITFAVAALLLVLADHELHPMSRSLLAAPHSMVELKAQLAKTVITVVDILLWSYPKVQGVVFALCTVASFYYHMKQLPYYTYWMNSFRLCFLAVHAWVAVHLCVLVFAVKAHIVKKGGMGFIEWEVENYETAKAITDSMAYGVAIVFCGAGLAAAVRLYYFFRVALKFQRLQQQPTLYSKRVHRFADEKDVEICSRIARVWDEDGVLDQQCLDLAETILRAGIQQFPKSPFLHIMYANLLIECRQQLQSGWAQLEEARRMPLNLSYRFSIFTREQEHKQKAAVSSSGESAADLVSYVEFQRNYRLIQSYHKAALVAMREFWRLLLNDAVKLNSLTSAFRKIEQMEKLADKTYKVVLERYPKAVKLLRSYANFLETVKNDPWTAAQFYSEAEKQEEALENAEHDMTGEEGLNMRNSAIVTINAMGIIQMANKHAIKMLGYAKGELEGKNVSCLMPQPFSSRHNSYMRNYVTTGKAKILDSLREVVALHRDRYVFPIKIMVTKTQGTGADAVFMGLLKEVESDPHQIKAWVMTTGVTLCADASFTDCAGWAPNDLIGKPFVSIAADPDFVTTLLDHAIHSTEEELAEGIRADVLLTHKYAEDVPVSLKIDMGGTADQRLLVLTMTRRGEVVPTMVFDHHGRVLFANQALCSLLGTKPKDMRGRDIATLMPQPFGFLHHRWIKEAEASVARAPPSSCRAGAVHSLVSSNGVHVPVRLSITSREISGAHVNIVRATRISSEEHLDEQRLNITTDQHGHIISVSAAHHHGPHASTSGLPPALAAAEQAASRPQTFGFPAENLMGRKLYETVDIFQEWHAQGHSVMHAVKALAQHSSARPGSAWRVGVLVQHMSMETERVAKGEGEPQASEAPSREPTGTLSLQASRGQLLKRSNTFARSSMTKWRAAIMQVMGPEHTAGGTHYTIKLWRPELLSGVMELNERMNVVKADTAAGLIFGVPANVMAQQHLSRFLKLGGAQEDGGGGAGGPRSRSRSADGGQTALISMESLLGNKNVKGGMKAKSNAHKTGPRRIFEARHADGMPLQISFQVALKNGTSNTRLMAAIKPLNMIKGNVAVLYAALRGEDLDHFTADMDNGTASYYRSRTLTLSVAKEPHAASAKEQPPSHSVSGVSRLRSQNSGVLQRGGSSVHRAHTPVAGVKLGLDKHSPGLDGSPSALSAVAAGTAPGLASAGTLNSGNGRGDSAGLAASDEAVTTGHVKVELVDGQPEDKALDDQGADASLLITAATAPTTDPLATNPSDNSNMLATARDVDLVIALAPAPEKPEATAAEPPGAEGDAATDEKNAGVRVTSRQPSQRLKSPPPPLQNLHNSSSLSGSGSGANRPPISDDSAMIRPRHHEALPKERHLSRRFVTREWQEVEHVDPDQVPIPHDIDYDIEHHVGDEKDMAVSSSSSSHEDDDGPEADADKHVGKNTEGAADKMTREEALQRKRTMAAMEPGERAQYVRGVRRVKEWLASGYCFDRRDAEPFDPPALLSKSPPPLNNAEAWHSGRQLSRVMEEEGPPAKTHGSFKNHGGSFRGGAHGGVHGGVHGGTHGSVHGGTHGSSGGAAHRGAELNPDDQLITLDELAAEVENHGDDDEDEGEAEEEQLEEENLENGSGGGRGDGGDGEHKGHHHHHKGDGPDSSGMSRGRRLRRLLKMLSGQKVNVTRLRVQVLVVVAAILLVHTICFMTVIIYINKQKQFITEISAAGEAIDRSHFTAMYSRAIEAATRYAGFTSDDIPALADRLTTDIDRLEYLHQGLYLGFSGLRRPSDKQLSDLWNLQQWNVTEYKDTKVPSYSHVNMTLWNLGNDYISAVREVAFYATSNSLHIAGASNSTYMSPPPASLASTSVASSANVTLTSNRFWLFIRANVGESLYVGYLRVLNTLLLLAQDNISMLKIILISLLLAEGCTVCFGMTIYVFYLLWKASRSRAALFTVFLVIPQGQVKALASRHISTNQDDEDSEDDNASNANGPSGKQDGGDDGISDGASVVSAGGGARSRRPSTMYERSGNSATAGRKGITFNEKTETKHDGQTDTVLGRIKHALSRDMGSPARDASAAGGPVRRFFTRKRLTHTISEIKYLVWPFFAWGVIICIIYLVSYLQFASVEVSLVNLKMFERSTAQASRTMFYANELALESDVALQAALQPIVREEASWLDTVYSTTLYGGRTLVDGTQDGAHDENTGSLFAKQAHATLLFESRSCMRDTSSSCVSESDRYYEVSRHAIDPMMRRLMQEATLLGLDDLGDVSPESTRWQYVWQIARDDLHAGLTELVSTYRMDALASFQGQGTLHIVIFSLSWVMCAVYLWLFLKPYLQISSTETKRVAELLSQLPAELDVEGMVEESWLVVADTQLDREKSNTMATFAKSAMSVFSAVRLVSNIASARRSSMGQAPQPAGGGGSLTMAGAVASVGDYKDLLGGGGKGRGGSPLSDTDKQGGGLLLEKLKAGMASLGAGSGNGSTGMGADVKGLQEFGEGEGDGDGSGGGAHQHSLFGGLRGSPDVSKQRRRGSTNKVSPADSAEAMRPGNASQPADRPGTGEAKERRDSGYGLKNKVAPEPVRSMSGGWVAPEGGALPAGSEPRAMAPSPGPGVAEAAVPAAAGAAAGSVGAVEKRPVSPLLDMPMSLALPAVADGGVEQYVKPRGAALDVSNSNSAPAESVESPYHFNKPLSMVSSNTRYWTENEVWRPSSARKEPPPVTVTAAVAPVPAAPEAAASDARGNTPVEPFRGGGDDVAASATATAAATAVAENTAHYEEPLLLEVDDVVATAAEASAAVPTPFRVCTPSGGRTGITLTPRAIAAATGAVSPTALALPPSLVTAGLAPSFRSRLGVSSSRPVSPQVVSGTLVAEAAASSGLVVVERRSGLERNGSDSRPGSPSAPAAAAGTAIQGVGVPTSPSSPPAVAAGGVTVVSRRGSMEAGGSGSRPASRMAGLSPVAASIQLPPAPSFSRTGSGVGVRSPLGRGSAVPAVASSPLGRAASRGTGVEARDGADGADGEGSLAVPVARVGTAGSVRAASPGQPPQDAVM